LAKTDDNDRDQKLFGIDSLLQTVHGRIFSISFIVDLTAEEGREIYVDK